MALITSASLISYLKADGTTEGPLVDMLLTGSIGFVENYLNTTITAQSQSDQFNAPTVRAYTFPSQLVLRCYPIVSSSVVITSLYGATLYNYQLDTDRGIIYNGIVRPNSFPEYVIFGHNYPYVVTYTAGFQTAPDYSTRYEPLLNVVLQQIVADWWMARNPRVQSTLESGQSVTYMNADLSPVTKGLLQQLKRKPR